MAGIRGKAVVGQGGGPTCVINQSLVGVIEEAQGCGEIEEVLGAVHGVRGIKDEQFRPLKELTQDVLEAVAATPSAALGSTRDKVDKDYAERIFEVFQRQNVRYFFYIGGNDSADTAMRVSEAGRQRGYEIRVIHVPKTIDNDLAVTDHCPGYGSAARFVAQAFMGDNLDNRSLPGIKISIVMGRNAGWLTAASALAKVYEDDGPHLVYLPEHRLSMARFLADVERVFAARKRCVIAASEGIQPELADLTPDERAMEKVEKKTWTDMIQHRMSKKAEADSHGHSQLSGTGILGDFLSDQIVRHYATIAPGKKMRVRADTFGYLQRCFPGVVSPSDAREARRVGRAAVRYAVAGKSGSVILKRSESGGRYSCGIGIETHFDRIANQVKVVPPEFIGADRCSILPAFIEYARPLVGDLPAIGRLP